MKDKTKDKKEKEQQEQQNSIVIGGISLTSNCLSLDELIAKAYGIIVNKELREYLDIMKLTGTSKTADYMG